jgi:CheY-like chemotaxis protein
MAQILVVDDDLQTRNMMALMLFTEGHQVMQVPDGQEALQLIQRQEGDEQRVGSILPDLILLDIMMSGLSGYDVAERLKNDPRTSDIPIVFVTAKGEPEDVARSWGLAADYLHKPFSEAQLLSHVRNVLALRELEKEILSKRDLRHNDTAA